MDRSEVYTSIDVERDYQDRKWGPPAAHPHEVGAWITLMRNKLNDAERAWATRNNDAGALCEIRKVVATGIACGEQHGMPSRARATPVSERMRT